MEYLIVAVLAVLTAVAITNKPIKIEITHKTETPNVVPVDVYDALNTPQKLDALYDNDMVNLFKGSDRDDS